VQDVPLTNAPTYQVRPRRMKNWLVQPGGNKHPFRRRLAWAIRRPYAQTTLPAKERSWHGEDHGNANGRESIGKSNGLFPRPLRHPVLGRPARPAPATGQRWMPPASRRPARPDGTWGWRGCAAGGRCRGPEPNVMRLLAPATESLARGRLAPHFLRQGDPGPQRRARRPPQAVGPQGNDRGRHGFVFHLDARERQPRHARHAKNPTCGSPSGGQRRPRAAGLAARRTAPTSLGLRSRSLI